MKIQFEEMKNTAILTAVISLHWDFHMKGKNSPMGKDTPHSLLRQLLDLVMEGSI